MSKRDNTARTLAQVAGQLANIAAKLQQAAAEIGLNAPQPEKATRRLPAPAKEKILASNKVPGKRGRAPAPIVPGVKIRREHWTMSFAEFKTAILADHPNVGSTQMKNLCDSLREIKAQKGIEIKRGRQPSNVAEAKIVSERKAKAQPPRLVDVTPTEKPRGKKVPSEFDVNF